MNPKSINDIVKQVIDAMPEGVKKLPQDVKQNMHIAMLAVLNKLNVVTRAEFDAQQKVLAKTREKLEALEEELRRKCVDPE